MSNTNSVPKSITAQRIGDRRYVGRNERGGELVIGYGPGEFSPGELLKLALLGCNTLSSEARFAAALGDDYQVEGSIDATYLKEDDRFTEFFVDLDVDLSALDPEEQERVHQRARKAIDRNCTITHTVAAGAPVAVTIAGVNP